MNSVLSFVSFKLNRLQSILGCTTPIVAYKRCFSTTAVAKMRFVQFLYNGKQNLGLEKEENSGQYINLNANGDFPYNTMMDFLAAGSRGNEDLHRVLSQKSKQQLLSREEVQLLAPITKPDKVVCIGMNYRDHCEEQGAPLPAEPVIFNKFPSTIVGPYDDVILSEETTALDWEVELALIIGKSGKKIKNADAMNHVFGYTVAHDVSARDWQMHRNGGQWFLGKTMDTFCPLGPSIVTTDEVADPHNLGIRCRVNDVLKQDSNTKEIVHQTEKLVSFLSRFVTLLPGDVILTGTPPGVGCFRKPPEYLKKGDVVECEIEKIGKIRNKIV